MRLILLAFIVIPLSGISKDMSELQKLESVLQSLAKKFADVPQVKASEVQQRLKENPDVVLVDVREPRERRVSMIKGAITKEEFEKDLVKYGKREIIAYCTIGHRSAVYVKSLRKKQKQLNISSFLGSILAWTHLGGELVDAKGSPSKKVHVYGEKWRLVAPGYEAVTE